MKRYGRHSSLVALVTMLLAMPFQLAWSTAFPDRPIRVLVGFTPGSSIDATTRLFAQELTKVLNTPIVVENRPGASGQIATLAAKAAPADGYTILATGMSHSVINPIMMKNAGYDPIADFKIISGMTRSALAIVVPSASPIKTLGDLTSASPPSRAPLNAGAYSEGYRLYTEWLGIRSGVKFNIVPYRGAAAVVTDLLGKNIDFAMVDIAAAVPFVKAGTLRILAVTSADRLPRFPNVPTVRESGYPDFVGYATVGLQVSAQTPFEVTNALREALRKVARTKAVVEFAEVSSLEAVTEDAENLQEQQRLELERLREVARSAGIKAQ